MAVKSPTVEDLISRAYKLIGVTGQNRPLDGYQKQEGLSELNTLVTSFGNGTQVPIQTTLPITLTAGQAQYTVSSQLASAYIDSNSIIELMRGQLQIDADNWRPLRVIESGQFQSYRRNVTQNIPSMVFLEKSNQSSIIHFVSTPDSNYYVELFVKQYIEPFEQFSSVVNFPPNYFEYLKYLLGKNLSAYYDDNSWSASKENRLKVLEKSVLASNAKDLFIADYCPLYLSGTFRDYYGRNL